MRYFKSKITLSLCLIFLSIFCFANTIDDSGIDTPKTFDRIFMFGDSLSDTGNTHSLLRSTLPESPPYFKGRFSNGPVWLEVISKQLNLSPELVINYAFGGARAIKDDLPIPSLEQQVAKYLKWNQTADPNALYIVWSGSNDIMNDVHKKNYQKNIDNINKRVKEQFILLINHGVKTFFVPNLPAIAITPKAKDYDQRYGNTVYSEQIDRMTTYYNMQFAETLLNLQLEYPQVTFITFDAYNLLNNASELLRDYGITDTEKRCNPNWFAYNYLKTCENPNSYLFWDDVHPTGNAHVALADLFEQALENAGFVANDTLIIPSAEDLQIAKSNQQAIKELTARKFSFKQKELLFRNKLLF